MAIKSYNSEANFQSVGRKIKTSLNLPDGYLENVSSVLMLKALGNIVRGNRPFQKNVEDVKDIFPVVVRSQYFSNWRYKYKAICNNNNCNIILRPNNQNEYEYVQITFDGAAQEFKAHLAENDKLLIFKTKGSDVYDIRKIPVTDLTFNEDDDFILINPKNKDDNTFFGPPIMDEDPLIYSTANAITSTTNLRDFAFKVFKELNNNLGSERLLSESTIKFSKINQINYIGISIPAFFGADNLIGSFESEQTKQTLSSAGTQRYFEEKITLDNYLFTYFTTQWGDTDEGTLTFKNLSRYILSVSFGLYEASKENGSYILKKHSYINYPLNQILYGAPGTGKTHNAVNHALAVIKGYSLKQLIETQKSSSSARKLAKKEYDELVLNGQIQFVTFHQSYSYEEFVEGIKPSVVSGNVEYDIVDGVFKKICEDAGGKIL